MKRKRGRPKEPKNIPKINPPNVHIHQSTDTTFTNTDTITIKCDNPKCNSPAEMFFNLKYCKLCAKDKGLDDTGSG